MNKFCIISITKSWNVKFVMYAVDEFKLSHFVGGPSFKIKLGGLG
jgi:hypothetical protein